MLGWTMGFVWSVLAEAWYGGEAGEKDPVKRCRFELCSDIWAAASLGEDGQADGRRGRAGWSVALSRQSSGQSSAGRGRVKRSRWVRIDRGCGRRTRRSAFAGSVVGAGGDGVAELADATETLGTGWGVWVWVVVV